MPGKLDRSNMVVPLLGVLTLIAVGMTLEATQAVVLPLVVAWLLSYVFGPVVNVLNARKIPTPISTALILIFLLALCYLSGIFLKARLDAFLRAYPIKYESRLAFVMQDLSARWHFAVDPFAGVDWGEQIRRILVRVSGSALSFISTLVMVLIFLVFLLLGKPYFHLKLRKALSPGQAERFDNVLRAIGGQISRYLFVQLMLSLVTGTLVWLVLMLLDVDFAITWGALAFFMNFIPTVGAIVASVPPILLALVQFYPSVGPAAAALALIAVIHVVIGNGIAPKLMGDRLNLSPVVVLLSLIFWGWLWGFTGALLSVPIAAAIKIVCENVESLRPFSIMMGSGKDYQREFRHEQALAACRTSTSPACGGPAEVRQAANG